MKITPKQLFWCIPLAIALGFTNLDPMEIVTLAIVGGLVISLTVRSEEDDKW